MKLNFERQPIKSEIKLMSLKKDGKKIKFKTQTEVCGTRCKIINNLKIKKYKNILKNILEMAECKILYL